jgi:hypothetical protein
MKKTARKRTGIRDYYYIIIMGLQVIKCNVTSELRPTKVNLKRALAHDMDIGSI